LEAGFDDVLALGASESLLDVGCGDGAYIVGLRAAGHVGRLVGIDIEPELVAAARDRAADVGGSAGPARDAEVADTLVPRRSIEFDTADAAHLPFPDASFDAVTTRYVIDHLSDPGAAVAEVRRVIGPGGRLVRIANGEGHLAEFWNLVPSLAPMAGPPLETRFVELAARSFDSVTVSYLSRVVTLPDATVAVALLDTHRVALRHLADAAWSAARSDLLSRSRRAPATFPLPVTLRLCVVRADVHARGEGH